MFASDGEIYIRNEKYLSLGALSLDNLSNCHSYTAVLLDGVNTWLGVRSAIHRAVHAGESLCVSAGYPARKASNIPQN